MNALFILYGGIRTNSYNHARAFADGLRRLGHSCVIAIPDEPNVNMPAGHVAHDRLGCPGDIFPDRRAADVIHAWTPRQNVLKSLILYQRACPRPARVTVHLEDNEDHLLAAAANTLVPELHLLGGRRLEHLLCKGFSHPVRHKLLLGAADLVTVITDKLVEHVPDAVRVTTLRPGIDLEHFRPLPPDPAFRQTLGLDAAEKVIVYTGGVNFANSAELKTLYLAVARLNRDGCRTRLLRTGPASPAFEASLGMDARAATLHLGFVTRDRLPEVLALADVLVQPGIPGLFNDYRLPSKIPEFLASGRPVILPPTNIAGLMTDGNEALFLRDGSPEDITTRCREVFERPELGQRLGEAGRRFATQHFDLKTNTLRLEALYKETLAARSRATWSRLSIRFHDEADLLLPTDLPKADSAILALARQRRRKRWLPRLLGRILPRHRASLP